MSHVCFGLLYIQIVHSLAVKDFGSKETWSGNPALTLRHGALCRLGNHWVQCLHLQSAGSTHLPGLS